jgi:hypothetical protein
VEFTEKVGPRSYWLPFGLDVLAMVSDHNLGSGQNSGRLAGITGSKKQLVFLSTWYTKEPHIDALNTLVSMGSTDRVAAEFHRIRAWRF